MIFMPPRHGKSMLTSEHFPPWLLGRFPHKNVMLCSHTADFAASWGRKARDVIEDVGSKMFGVQVRGDSSAADRWQLQGATGGMVTAGVGAAITGRGADVLIIDDPVKDLAEAYSPTVRQHTWDWYTGTALTRLEPGGAVVLIMTRWHIDDLAGRLLKAQRDGGEGSAKWEVLSLPALAEADDQFGPDALGRKPGEALWPERFDAPALIQRKQEMGTRMYTAEYQQRPLPDEGGGVFLREWWKYYDSNRITDSWEFRLFSIDTAFKDRTQNDYSVVAMWCVMRGELYVPFVFRAKMQYPELKRSVANLAAQWRPNALLIEDAASGQSLIQELRRSSRFNIPVIAARPDSDKYTRAVAAAPEVEAGKVYLPAGAPWVHEFIEEHANFPNGVNDDQVDTTTQAIRYLRSKGGVARIHDLYGQHRMSRNENPLGLPEHDEKYWDRDVKR